MFGNHTVPEKNVEVLHTVGGMLVLSDRGPCDGEGNGDGDDEEDRSLIRFFFIAKMVMVVMGMVV